MARGHVEHPTLPALATAAEVADWLRTSRKAVYAMVERGQIPGVVRIRRRVLFDRARLVEWLEKRRAVSPQE
ncbi:MAG: DNA-binding protein [Deltaproteobacteria bacterium]|nr:MAG: DNA-binding protein [Deltaproteobacteria bacterium]